MLPFSPGITRFFSLFNDTQLDVRFSRASISRVRASSSRCVRRGGKYGREEKEEEAKDASSRGDRSSIKKKNFLAFDMYVRWRFIGRSTFLFFYT